jgi:hypothetical protein
MIIVWYNITSNMLNKTITNLWIKQVMVVIVYHNRRINDWDGLASKTFFKIKKSSDERSLLKFVHKKTIANKFLKILYKGSQPYHIQPNSKFQINK